MQHPQAVGQLAPKGDARALAVPQHRLRHGHPPGRCRAASDARAKRRQHGEARKSLETKARSEAQHGYGAETRLTPKRLLAATALWFEEETPAVRRGPFAA